MAVGGALTPPRDRTSLLRTAVAQGSLPRKIAAALSIGVHLALAAVLLGQHPQPVDTRSAGITLITVTVPAPSPARTHARPRTVSRTPTRLAVAPVFDDIPGLPVQPANAVRASAAGVTCDLTDPVQAALRNDPRVLAQLPGIPVDRRSVANAVALWNQDWVRIDDTRAQAAITPVRETVLRVVEAATDDCRNQIQAGPRLIYLSDGNGQTTIFALGSGQWTWQQVARTGRIPPIQTQSAANTAPDNRFLETWFGRSNPVIRASMQPISLQPDPLRLPATPKSAG